MAGETTPHCEIIDVMTMTDKDLDKMQVKIKVEKVKEMPPQTSNIDPSFPPTNQVTLTQAPEKSGD